MENDECSSENHFRVFSIQSHVVSGYVGNKTACFPLQLLGFEVDYLNSVQLSNHTGYKHIKGQVIGSKELEDLYDGLKSNQLLTYTHVLTGYVGKVEFLKKLVAMIKELKEINADLFVVCDPVMGDNGKLYVPAEVLPIYRDDFIPISDLITPNQFEAELLTGISISTQEDVLRTMNALHQKGVKIIVLSSVELLNAKNLKLFGSSNLNNANTVVWMEIPKLSGSFTGSGDLLSALLLAWMAKTDGDLRVSCEKAINTMQCVLKRTLEYASKNKNPESMAAKELKLIQSKKDIENPPVCLKCYTL